MDEKKYLSEKRKVIAELFQIETERKRINERWSEAVKRNKALDNYLLRG